MGETLLQGRYRLDDPIGEGGMGAVYRGFDTVLKRPVAIKLLSNLAAGSAGSERAIVEAQATAQLNDPHIVSVYDVGWSGQTPFIVMELVEGQNLRCDVRFPVEEVIALGRQLCQALAHAHAKGIVHRDLKPENILVTSSGTVKLMDFGLARIAHGPRLTQEGTILGTTNYIAPELLSGRAASPQSDLYALGVILYELAAGQPPFSGDSLVAILAQHLHAPVTPPSNHQPDIPAALDTLILKLLEKEPSARPASAAEVEQALAQIADTLQRRTDLPRPAEFSLLDRIVRGRLVGRHAELAHLHHLWQTAWLGQAQLALISGEPGGGKTRLANELLVEAQLRGIPVLRGGCYEYEAVTPYLPFVEALRDWVHHQPAERLRDVLGLEQSPAIAAELAKLAPEIETKLGPQPPNPTLSPEDTRSRMFDYIALFLSSLAAPNGLVLFIDDLHWTDNGTLNLLHYLLRRLRQEKLLILANYREGELDRSHPLAAALVSWNRERWVTRVALSRLTAQETAEMLAAIFGQESVALEFAAAIHQETEGNPFFVEEVVKTLIEQGEIFREDGRWSSHQIEDLAIPQSVKEAIGRRLDRLTPECAAMLHVAAVLGKQFAFNDLEAVWRERPSVQQEDLLLDLIDEAANAQLLAALDQDRFAFSHDKIREVLVEELNPIRRRRLHQRIGQALETLYAVDLGGHVQVLAFHFTQATDLDRSMKYCQLAGAQAASLFSLDEAARYYDQARECAELLGRADARLEIEQVLGDIHLLRGAFADAAAAFGRALPLAVTASQRAALQVKLAGVPINAGDDSRIGELTAAINELDAATQPRELAEALTYLGRYHHFQNEFAAAIANFEQAQQLAESLGDIQLLTTIYSFLAGAYQHRIEFAPSIMWAQKLVALGQAHAYPPAEALGLEFLAEASNLLGRWSDALDYAAREKQIAEKIGAQDRVCWALFNQVWTYQRSGELRQAVDRAPSTLELAQTIGDTRAEFLTRYAYALALIDLGDLALAESLIDGAEANAAAQRQRFMTDTVVHLRMAVSRQRERWRDVLALAQPFFERPDEFHRVVYYNVAPLVAEALVHVSALAAADSLLASYLARLEAADLAYLGAIGQRVFGQLKMAQGQLDDALQALTRSVDTHASQGARPELVRSLIQRGLLHERRGDLVAAQADLHEAETLAAEIGMVPDRDRAQKVLGSLAPRPM